MARNTVSWSLLIGTRVIDGVSGTQVSGTGTGLRFVPTRVSASWKTWRTTDRGVFSWSPDQRRVLTYGLFSADDGSTRRIAVRNATTGEALRTFRGYFSSNPG